MYGSWFGFTLGAVGVVMLVLAAMRRTAEDTRGAQIHAGDPESHAAPVGGEGSIGRYGDAPPEPEQAPEPESAGVRGEKG